MNVHKTHGRIPAMLETGALVLGAGLAPEAPDAEATAQTGHVFSSHTPVWAYMHPVYGQPFDPALNSRPAFEVLGQEASIPEVMAKTGLAVFLGACDSPAFRAFCDNASSIVLVFEPDRKRFQSFVRGAPASELTRSNLFYFVGDPASFDPPLSQLLPPGLFATGFPVFYVEERIACGYPAYAAWVAERVEMLYFRYTLYHIEGQGQHRGRPIRNLATGLFYDQQKHFYENIGGYLVHGALDELRNSLKGCEALCVAAGPDLDAKIEYIRRNRGNAALIAVNNSLKPLLAQGIVPDFVVVNDTSCAVEQSFEGLPAEAVRDTILVAHCLSPIGPGVFSRVYFFGSHRPDVFGERASLRLHGSVLTTMLALARHLGCPRATLVGAQLASPDPYTFAYSRASVHGQGQAETAPQPLIHKHPQLYPVKSASGQEMYTTLNFRDACFWLLDELKRFGPQVVNTTAETIVYGPGIVVDPDFAIPPDPELAGRLQALRERAPDPARPDRNRADPRQAEALVLAEIESWRTARALAASMLAALEAPDGEGAEALPKAQALIAELDAAGVSYLLQRYAEFDNALFHESFFTAPTLGLQVKGAAYYFGYLKRMAQEFLKILGGQLQGVKGVR